jgi:multisubunit Na+/H+ antiporter MnhG subunit
MRSEQQSGSESSGIDRLTTRAPRLSVCLFVLLAVVSVDGSYAALIGLNDGARTYLGSSFFRLMLTMPIPAIGGGLVAFLMTLGSRLSANAGVLTAIVLAAASMLFALLRVLAIPTWGGDMQGLMVILDFIVLCAVALAVPPVSYLCVRSAYRDRLPQWRRAETDKRQARALEALKRQRHW